MQQRQDDEVHHSGEKPYFSLCLKCWHFHPFCGSFKVFTILHKTLLILITEVWTPLDSTPKVDILFCFPQDVKLYENNSMFINSWKAHKNPLWGRCCWNLCVTDRVAESGGGKAALPECHIYITDVPGISVSQSPKGAAQNLRLWGPPDSCLHPEVASCIYSSM